jgi:hypothetical protein
VADQFGNGRRVLPYGNSASSAFHRLHPRTDQKVGAMEEHPKQSVAAIEVVAPGTQNDKETKAYSIGTLVRNREKYEAMRDTFLNNGFSGQDCEYLFVDNTREGEQTSAYRGLNAILNAAHGTYVILCHQDVQIFDDNRTVLDDRLAEMDRIDPNWAVVGNAGCNGLGEVFMRITDPYEKDQHRGSLPAKVVSLDENFIVARRDARLAFSNDLCGFHFYGTDICLNADVRGYTAYVINFHLKHLSGGKLNDEFYKAKEVFKDKWTKALRRRSIKTTCTELFYLDGGS